MGNRVVFEMKPPAEEVERVFDFTSLLAEGETLAAATVEIEVFAGTDADPEAMLAGEPTVDGPRVIQVYREGTLGVVYTTTCYAGTCNGQLHSLAAYLGVLRGATT